MKTVLITGSARGFGYSMLTFFRKNDFNVIICDINEKSLEIAKKNLNSIFSKGMILSYKMDVTKESDVKHVITDILNKTQGIDIWINNAGVNQMDKPIWELDSEDVNRLIDIDLKGTILCSKLIVPIFLKQGYGSLYNVEGYGSDNQMMMGLSIYGTAKRAVTYFTKALAKEIKSLKTSVSIGRITPGIMITNFIETSMGDGEKIKLSEKTKKVYNILGDYPDIIAEFMVNKIIKNKKNNVKFVWLTKRKSFMRFLTSPFKKRDFFQNN